MDIFTPWVALLDAPEFATAEHYVAESGWLLARVQRAPGGRRWDWNVATHTRIVAHGTEDDLDAAKRRCVDVGRSMYLDYARPGKTSGHFRRRAFETKGWELVIERFDGRGAFATTPTFRYYVDFYRGFEIGRIAISREHAAKLLAMFRSP